MRRRPRLTGGAMAPREKFKLNASINSSSLAAALVSLLPHAGTSL